MGATDGTREILSITDVGEWDTPLRPGQRLWKIRYRVRGNKKGPKPETYVAQDLVVGKDELDAVIELNKVLADLAEEAKEKEQTWDTDQT